MKYEFHVGDYVETVGGFVGWISAIRNNEYIIIVDKNNNRCGYYMPQESRYFARIGQYDFTKPEQPKEIEKLKPGWRGDEAYRKINELVDAVNELRNK
nr:MAG TPA: Preprotein translocase subunit [Caudoviricetes sp.]